MSWSIRIRVSSVLNVLGPRVISAFGTGQLGHNYVTWNLQGKGFLKFLINLFIVMFVGTENATVNICFLKHWSNVIYNDGIHAVLLTGPSWLYIYHSMVVSPVLKKLIIHLVLKFLKYFLAGNIFTRTIPCI